jgi:cytochrome c2
MSDEYFNHDGEGSGFFSLILLAVFLLGGFVVARVYEPGQAIGADAAKARLAKREKIETAASGRLAGHAVVSKEKNFVSLPIGTAVTKVAELGSEGTRAALVERSIEKDGKYEAPTLIAKGKALFTAKTCNLCHTVDPAIPATLGLVYKSPQFIGDFWGKEREVHIGYYPELNFNAPIQKVVFNEQYFIESVKLPYEKVVKGVLSPMVFAFPVNDEEILALMAYVKSLSK